MDYYNKEQCILDLDLSRANDIASTDYDADLEPEWSTLSNEFLFEFIELR